ncbi:Acyl carrier protein [Zhongshania aliphaticivorans]|uniref:Acyl carrier protein n=1 Tax=Zhongshania aliphaticivorans TaxID=1470434 RepID=A0A5S9NLK7_9GAMM|nr:acyl carrier protein [Zhongshania aliphaticivorans]CAA0091571.1 Acyl carrier protein [Zhongshania aliphaticivorans]CAA0098922.1 Acyl carrier protein [Zhongshania aliphaticivorans]
MHSRADIYQHIVDVMSNLFEIPPEKLTEDAELYDELDIDSIDAVDLIVELKNFTGKKIAPDDFKSVRTIGDIVNAVEELLKND